MKTQTDGDGGRGFHEKSNGVRVFAGHREMDGWEFKGIFWMGF
jgi:hypothetical protein